MYLQGWSGVAATLGWACLGPILEAMLAVAPANLCYAAAGGLCHLLRGIGVVGLATCHST